MEEEAFNASSYEYNAKDEDEAFEDALTSDDDYSGDEEDQDGEEERERILKNEGNVQRRKEISKRDVRKWQKMNTMKRGRGDLGKQRKNTTIVCPPVSVSYTHLTLPTILRV